MAEVDRNVNLRFEGDLWQALEEGLSLFSVVQLKAAQRFIIEKIVDTVLRKSLTFQLLPGVLKSLKGYEFPSNPLAVVISPLMSIGKDQVKYLRSKGTQAGYIGENKMKNREILNREGAFSFVQKPAIIHWGEEIQGKVLYAV